MPGFLYPVDFCDSSRFEGRVRRTGQQNCMFWRENIFTRRYALQALVVCPVAVSSLSFLRRAGDGQPLFSPDPGKAGLPCIRVGHS